VLLSLTAVLPEQSSADAYLQADCEASDEAMSYLSLVRALQQLGRPA
jgi:hypothetical protein